MAEEAGRPGHDSVTRTNTEAESRDTEAPRRPVPSEDTPRTNTEAESRSGEREEVKRPPEQPDTLRG